MIFVVILFQTASYYELIALVSYFTLVESSRMLSTEGNLVRLFAKGFSVHTLPFTSNTLLWEEMRSFVIPNAERLSWARAKPLSECCKKVSLVGASLGYISWPSIDEKS